ncbi:redoxin family protein [Spirosoma sp. HMF4905]|uniref:Redoxin family protein n=1 Tax=Spirosoma arboris TaxID=2682092 RepID=A0A7K1SPJ4_9BACT|nr:TlpA disulfide reductase family protein [Spirosoma arboris]MVM35719.1 redoxin family protein [Spirosoma arboris]
MPFYILEHINMSINVLLILLTSSLFLMANRTPFLADGVHISIHMKDGNGQPVTLSTPNVFTLEPVELGNAKLDASGNAVLDIPVNKVQFANIQIGEKLGTLLLSPGDNLRISVVNQERSPFIFSGKGAEAATFLAQTSSIWHNYETKGGKHLLQLEPDEFVNRLDSVQKAYDKLALYSAGTVALKPVRHLLMQRNAVQLLTYKLNYCMSRFGSDELPANVPPTLKNVVSELPFDSSLLEANTYEYGFLLAMYEQLGLYAPLFAGKSKDERMSIQDQLPQLADQQISLRSYPASIRTFLRAKNIYDSLKQWGITSATDSLVEAIKKEPGYQAYASVIQEKYDSWLALAPGKAAPNFSGLSPEGKPLLLTDLKGKVVYVDVWATWCVPCREEFPQAKQLQARFADNNQVAFLYVSIDRNQEAWKKMLAGDPDFKGVHMNQPPGEQFESFGKAYQLGSIPRYMLIDQTGNLVNVNADRPSSGKVGEAIQQLLQ